NEAANPPQPLANGGVETSVHERDPPVGDISPKQADVSRAVREHEVVRRGLVVVEEEVLDVRPAVAQAEYEVRVAEVCVISHHMPEQRALPDHCHWFWRICHTIAHPHTQAATEQNNFHATLLQITSSSGIGKTSRPPHCRT